jgi:hypothetical protein
MPSALDDECLQRIRGCQSVRRPCGRGYDGETKVHPALIATRDPAFPDARCPMPADLEGLWTAVAR